MIARFGLLAFALLCLGMVARAAAQVSPGELARPHAKLEGALQCTRCHGSGKDAMPARCVACHRDIGWLAGLGRGLHGTPATKSVACASCHPDHAGVDFSLVKWPDGSPARFDHRRAGFALERSHRELRCEQCHSTANRRSPAAALAVGGSSRWTGLEPGCASCHADPHKGALGARCTGCHDAGHWSATPGFSHDTTAYPLTGRHQRVACNQCHADARIAKRLDAQGERIPVYRPVPFQSCANCHQDVHGGRFGATCSSCHVTQSFQQVSPAGFDHGKTRFPLRGKHASVKCASCHRDWTSSEGRKPAAATCSACHADPHAGTAMLGGRPTDCAGCHSESGFRPGQLTVEEHGATRYPLGGKHRSVACGSCHRVDRTAAGLARWGVARVMIRPGFATCATCHADDHGGQLARRPGGGECAACHEPSGWRPSSFDRAAHRGTRLPLDGRHAALACSACHGAAAKAVAGIDAAGLGKARVALAPPARCVACHADPHRGRFEPTGQSPVAESCAGCHDTRAFRPSTVDVARHQSFRFALTGAHRATPCVGCHRGSASATYEAPVECAGCHRSAHGTQFDARKDGGRCDGCHGTDAFRPATGFDHDRDASFPLKGSHQRVACAACHRAAEGTAVIRYRAVATQCESCHANGRR